MRWAILLGLLLGCRSADTLEPHWSDGPGADWVHAALERSRPAGDGAEKPLPDLGQEPAAIPRRLDEAVVLAALIPPPDPEMRTMAADAADLNAWLAKERSVLELEQLVVLRDRRLAAQRSRIAATLEGYDQLRFLGDVLGPFRAFTGKVPSSSYPIVESLRAELVDKKVELSWQELKAVAVDRLASVREQCARLGFLAHEQRVTSGHIELVSSLEPVIRSRFATGETRQADLLLLEAELERLRGRIEELGIERLVHIAALNGLLDRDPQAPIIDPLPEDLIPPRTVEGQLQQAIDAHPELGAARSVVGMRLAALRLAEEIALGSLATMPLSGRGYSPTELHSGLRSGAGGALLRESELRLQAAQEDLAGTESNIRTRVFDAHARWAAANVRRRVLAEEVLPREKSALEGLKGSLSGGGVSYLDVHEAARSLLRTELGLARAELDARLAMAGSMRSSGVR